MRPDWEKDKLIITKAYFDSMNECTSRLVTLINDRKDILDLSLPLIGYVIDRVDAVLVLTQNWLLWDADIIVRSCLETLMKFALIAEAEPTERPQLYQEYWHDLSDVYRIKLSDQNKKNLTRTDGSEIHHLAYAPLVLEDEAMAKLRAKWSKPDRTRLEQKWSFTGIINALSKNNTGNFLERIDLLTHTYRMCSHIAHGDELGINIIAERRSRPEQEMEDVMIAHYLRLMSDCFGYTFAAAYFTCEFLKVDIAMFMDLFKKLEEINKLTEVYHMVPFEDNMYDKYRKAGSSSNQS